MSYERLWERLLENLNGWSTATEVAPGQIELTVAQSDGSERVVYILMTSGEWEDIATVACGNFDLAAEHVKRWVLQLQDGEHFLLYDDYQLSASAEPELPSDPESERLDALARKHPEGIGHWFTTAHDGTIVESVSRRTDREPDSGPASAHAALRSVSGMSVRLGECVVTAGSFLRHRR